MKRTIGALLFTLTVALGLAVPAMQPVGAAPEPKPCSIVQYAGGGYLTIDGAATVAVHYDLAGPACGGNTVTLYAKAADGSVLASQPATKTKSAGNDVLVTVPGAPASVCVVLSLTSGSKELDHVPTWTSNECADGAYTLLDGGTGGFNLRG